MTFQQLDKLSDFERNEYFNTLSSASRSEGAYYSHREGALCYSVIKLCEEIHNISELMQIVNQPYGLSDIDFHLRAIKNIIHARKSLLSEPTNTLQSPGKIS